MKPVISFAIVLIFTIMYTGCTDDHPEDVVPFVLFPFQDTSVVLFEPIELSPELRDTQRALFSWYVDNTLQPGDGPSFIFSPINAGSHTITLKVSNPDGRDVSSSVRVEGISPSGNYRPCTPESNMKFNIIYDFTPAPGQFINKEYSANTKQEAIDWATEQLSSGKKYISLGGWGGYIIVGFDHSIGNRYKEYDFKIKGNPFPGSSEPGIVYVMQDQNGNGLPDDIWYELRGSTWKLAGYQDDYSITYFKPSVDNGPVKWEDNRGNTGEISRIGTHTQSYYPSWIKAESYTLQGSILPTRSVQENGVWKNQDYEWGYADNYGEDLTDRYNRFDIDDAINIQGKPVNLKFIDFIKIQTGVNASAGILGELSTEVFDIRDIE